MKYVIVLCLYLLSTISSSALPLDSSPKSSPVFDTAGEPLQRGVEYYIAPATTGSGGLFTPIDRYDNCTYYAGQSSSDMSLGFPVIFEPFNENETLVRLSGDYKLTFSVVTTCMTSTTWQLKDAANGERRLIGTGVEGSYFRVEEIEEMEGVYRIRWCPTEVCPLCKFDCGTVGALVEDGNTLLALDGHVIPVVFQRA